MAFALFFGIQQALAGVASAPPAPPPTAVSDDFNRADSPNLGANWTTTDSHDSPQINSQVANDTTGNGYSEAIWTADAFANDQYSEAEVVVGSGSAGVCVRRSIDFSSGYFAQAYLQSGNYHIFLGRSDTDGTISDVNIGASWPGIIRLEAVGTSIKVYTLATHGGTKTEQISVTDSLFASGSAGVTIWEYTGVGNVDNWYGGDI